MEKINSRKELLNLYENVKHLMDGRVQDPSIATIKGESITIKKCGYINPEVLEETIATRGYQALAKAIFDMTPEEVIEEVIKSGLRGRGGAGFPTGTKWKFAKASKGKKKYIVCNADEGDPGAFMDRSILEGDPHVVLEAMAIAGYAIGADEGEIYVRAEYPIAVKRLQTAIAQATEHGLLGDNILGSDFAILIGMVFTYLPFMVMPIYTQLEKIDPLLHEAALDLGLTDTKKFFKVVLPLSSKGIVSGSITVLLPCLSGFAIPKILGKGNVLLIGNIIEQSFYNMDFNGGSVLAVLLLIIILGVIFIINKTDKEGETLI